MTHGGHLYDPQCRECSQVHSEYPPLSLGAAERVREAAKSFGVPLYQALTIAAAAVGHLNCKCSAATEPTCGHNYNDPSAPCPTCAS